MKKIDICFSPELLPQYEIKDKIVVVVDILRATSTMVTALACGVAKIIPVMEVQECREWQKKGFLASAERDGKKIEGFDLDNSPFSYQNPDLVGKTIAITTTNGTLAIKKSYEATQIIVGAFLNISAIVNHLKKENKDVLVLCAGWKGKVNLEDTMFAGALVEALQADFDVATDDSLMAQILYNHAKTDMLAVIDKCSHIKRLQNLGIEKDIDFCFQIDKYTVVPVMKGDFLEVIQDLDL